MVKCVTNYNICSLHCYWPKCSFNYARVCQDIGSVLWSDAKMQRCSGRAAGPCQAGSATELDCFGLSIVEERGYCINWSFPS